MTNSSKIKITAANLKVLNEHLGTKYQHDVETDIKVVKLPSTMVRNIDVLYCHGSLVLLPDTFSRYPLSVVVAEYFLKNFGDGYMVEYLTPNMAILDSNFPESDTLNWLKEGGADIAEDVVFSAVGRGRKVSR